MVRYADKNAGNVELAAARPAQNAAEAAIVTVDQRFEMMKCVTLHYAPENFVAAMALGGVFERHPNVRFGVIELSATWVGP
jgi:hypothetical protein